MSGWCRFRIDLGVVMLKDDDEIFCFSEKNETTKLN